MKNSKQIYPWLLVGLLWVVALLNYLDRQILSTMQNSIKIDITELQKAETFGQLMAVFLWVYAFAGPIAGYISDKFNKKWIIISSLCVWSAITFLMGFAQTFNQLYILRALMGISEALYLPAALALIAELHEGKSRALAIGLHMTGLYVGQALGGFGATFAQMLSWHEAFMYLGLFGVGYSAILLIAIRNENRSTNQTILENQASQNIFKTIFSLIKTPAFLIILFYFCAISMPSWASKNWLPTLFAQNLNLDMTQAGPIATISLAMSSFFGVIVGGILSDKLVAKFSQGRVYVLASGLLLCAIGLIFMGFSNSAFLIITACVCFGVGFGFLDSNNMPVLCQFVDNSRRATAYGLMNTVGVSAGAVITIFFGRFADAGNLGISFALLAVAMIIVLVIVLFGLRPTTK